MPAERIHPDDLAALVAVARDDARALLCHVPRSLTVDGALTRSGRRLDRALVARVAAVALAGELRRPTPPPDPLACAHELVANLEDHRTDADRDGEDDGGPDPARVLAWARAIVARGGGRDAFEDRALQEAADDA